MWPFLFWIALQAAPCPPDGGSSGDSSVPAVSVSVRARARHPTKNVRRVVSPDASRRVHPSSKAPADLHFAFFACPYALREIL